MYVHWALGTRRRHIPEMILAMYMQAVLSDLNGDVFTITLNRPAKFNSFNLEVRCLRNFMLVLNESESRIALILLYRLITIFLK
jgi:hypothetical protein